MLLELPISKVLLEGKGEESTEGEREAEWWELIVKSSPQILSKREKRSTMHKFVQVWLSKRFNIDSFVIKYVRTMTTSNFDHQNGR